LSLDSGAHVRVIGKGRKERVTPITKNTVGILRAWLREIAAGDNALLLPSSRGNRLSPDAVQYLLAKHVAAAQRVCPSLNDKRITPHVLRHYVQFPVMNSWEPTRCAEPDGAS
jgi:site-specific recombinase XerC